MINNPRPKMMLRVNLLKDNGLDIMLLTLNDYYAKNQNKHLFFSKHGFTIQIGKKFRLQKNNILTIPYDIKKNNPHIDTLHFGSNIERYKLMALLRKSLIDWSKSEQWLGYNDNNRCRLTFNEKLWILF